MNQKTIITVIVVLIVAVGGLFGWYFLKEDTVESATTNTVPVLVQRERPPESTVWVVNGSFNPSVITVEVGDTVTWINKDIIDRRVASDPHPSSTDLPELVSEDLGEGDSYSYTFNEAGEYSYHDFLNPIKKGKIIVN